MGRISLKRDHQCPVCDGIEVIHVPRAVEHWEGVSPYITRLPVASVGDGGRVQTLGSYAVYLCAGCGFAEWYVSEGLERLRVQAEMGRGGLELLTAPSGAASPYRDTPVGAVAAPAAAGGGRYDVLVTSAGTGLAFARTLCDLAGLDAREVYALLKTLPAALLTGATSQVAERAKRRIEAAGGTARVQPRAAGEGGGRR